MNSFKTIISSKSYIKNAWQIDQINFKYDHIFCEHQNERYQKSRNSVLDTNIQAFQVPVTEHKYKKTKELYAKAKNPKDSDKAFILKIKTSTINSSILL